MYFVTYYRRALTLFHISQRKMINRSCRTPRSTTGEHLTTKLIRLASDVESGVSVDACTTICVGPRVFFFLLNH